MSDPADSSIAQAKPRRWRRAFMVVISVVATLTVMVLGVIALASSGVDVFKVESVVSRMRVYGVAIQVAIVILIGYRWHALVCWGQRHNIVQDHEFDRLIAFRPKAMAFLCAYLLLIPIGPQTLFKLLGMG